MIDTSDFDFLEGIVEPEEDKTPNPEEQTTPVVEDSIREEDTEEASDDESDSYTKYYEYLKDQGAINVPEDYEFVASEEGLLKALEATREYNHKEALNSIWESLPEEGKPLLQYFLSGGKDVSKFIQAHTPIDVDSVDLDDEDTQVRVLKQYYSEVLNYSKEKTDKIIGRLQVKDALKEGAQDALEDLKEHRDNLKESLVKEAQKEAAQRKVQEENERKLIKESLKELPSANPNKVESLLFNPVKYDGQLTTEFNYYLNKIATNPKHLVQLADLLTDYSPEKGFNLERFEKRAQTKKTQTLRAILDSKIDPRKQASQGSFSSPKGETFPFDKFTEF